MCVNVSRQSVARYQPALLLAAVEILSAVRGLTVQRKNPLLLLCLPSTLQVGFTGIRHSYACGDTHIRMMNTNTQRSRSFLSGIQISFIFKSSMMGPRRSFCVSNRVLKLSLKVLSSFYLVDKSYLCT